MKTYKHLWDDFISDENIRLAIKNACKHKTKRKEFKRMHDNPDKYIDKIRTIVMNFENSKHNPIEIYDGIQRKKRTIIVPDYIEQVVHHMIVNILKPIFLKQFYFHSYGSIPNKGAHLAKRYIERVMRSDNAPNYCLKMDIRKYFDSIPHDIMKQKLGALIKDKKFLHILYTIIDVVDSGLPLGFYTSQWLANWYLTDFDHYLKEELHIKYYYRYMDDMVVLSDNKEELHQIRVNIQSQLKQLGLDLKGNYAVFNLDSRCLDYMGFRFYKNKTVLRKSIFHKALKKAKRLSRKFIPTIYDIRQMLSYDGWFMCTDTKSVYNKYIKSYFDSTLGKIRISIQDRRSTYAVA